MGHSNTKPRIGKPYPTYPLTPHRHSGRWCKKILGKIHYFGPLDDWQGALERYQAEANYLHSGKLPPVDSDAFTVKDLANQFLNAKLQQSKDGTITNRSFRDYKTICDVVVGTLGNRVVDDLRPTDFAKLRTIFATPSPKSKKKNIGPATIGNLINRTKTVFSWGYKNALIDRPVRFGDGFARPPKRVMRRQRQSNAPKMFEPDQIHKLLQMASPQLRAMILLAINCGMGNSDCGQLLVSDINLESQWLDYPRPKTGESRRAKLWPETCQAIREVLDARKTKPGNDDYVFLTKQGNPWHQDRPGSPITAEFHKLLVAADMVQLGRSFYALRHSYETAASGCRDQVAINVTMGHADPSMAAVYRERIDDQRLVKVAAHVRRWLGVVVAS